MRAFLKCINWTLVVLICILVIALLIVFVQTACTREYMLLITRNGVSTMQQFWLDYKYIIKSLGAVLTLFVVSYNLMKYIDISTVSALSELRDKFNSPDNKKIHSYLLNSHSNKESIIEYLKKNIKNKDVSPEVLLFNYLGTIELGGIMLEKGIISYDDFFNQFGYRVINIFNNEEIAKHIQDNNKYYKVLLNIQEIMKQNNDL